MYTSTTTFTIVHMYRTYSSVKPATYLSGSPPNTDHISNFLLTANNRVGNLSLTGCATSVRQQETYQPPEPLIVTLNPNRKPQDRNPKHSKKLSNLGNCSPFPDTSRNWNPKPVRIGKIRKRSNLLISPSLLASFSTSSPSVSAV